MLESVEHCLNQTHPTIPCPHPLEPQPCPDQHIGFGADSSYLAKQLQHSFGIERLPGHQPTAFVHCLEAEMSIPEQANFTQDPSYIPRGPVIASLQFFDPPADGSKAWNYPLGTGPPPGQPRRNFGDADIAVTITDIRGQESKFSLDTNAFTTLNTTASTSSDFSSEKSIEETYYPEVKSLLHSHIPEAKRIVIFDHTIRLIGGDRPPVLRVHIDQTSSAAIGRARCLAVTRSGRIVER